MAVKLRPTFDHVLAEPIVMTRSGPSGETTETISELKVRKPLTGDLTAADDVQGEMAKNIAMLAHLTDQPVAVINKLEIDDFNALQAGLQGFLKSGQPTGGT